MGSIDFPNLDALQAADALLREAVAAPDTAQQKVDEISKLIPEEPLENVEAFVAAAIDSARGHRKMYYAVAPSYSGSNQED